ncbi:glycosyltransferase involved in cell wall biosynthesis [Rhodoblastus acidophilus]|uniref:glycosyltransferase n=1 Tax=Rhodoblastus acidophilus TaxID=1074 RepID=UPI0022242941|nr:glycosyltransferase [Rhodoblastus acidophilus]MCW2318650.1 glycosyltransferase involved in cell wall biosynthesis [Rhodoblastus acidophilus]
MIKIEPILQGRVHSIPHGVLGQALVARALPNTGAFLFFGRIQAYKGLGVLLDAAEILVSRGLEFSLTIAGAGPDIDGLRARIARLPMVRLDERYIPADEVGAIFGNCDVVVMPYLDATQSGVAALALSAARGVIVTDVGSITEVIRNGENGLVVPPGDANALAAAMAETLSAPELRQRLAAGAAATAASALSWDHVGAETVKVYRGAVSG